MNMEDELEPRIVRQNTTRHQPVRSTRVYDGVRGTVVNALRRIVLAEIPYVATHRDESRAAGSSGGFVVRANTGKLHDDALLDRLSLIPIFLTRDELLNFIPGSITVHLKVSNQGKFACDITSANLKADLFDRPHPKGGACFPANPATGDHVLITRLYPGEKIDVTATLEKATPATHAAFATASLVAVERSLDEDAREAEADRIRADASLDEKERRRRMNFLEHIDRLKMIKYTQEGEPVETRLTVESECGLSAEEIIRFAEEELLHKFTTDNISQTSTREHDSIVFAVAKQGHTFGSVMQEVCMKDKAELGIVSIGYYIMHPLEEKIVVRVALADEDRELVDPDALFSRLRVHCANYLRTVFR